MIISQNAEKVKSAFASLQYNFKHYIFNSPHPSKPQHFYYLLFTHSNTNNITLIY